MTFCEAHQMWHIRGYIHARLRKDGTVTIFSGAYGGRNWCRTTGLSAERQPNGNPVWFPTLEAAELHYADKGS